MATRLATMSEGEQLDWLTDTRTTLTARFAELHRLMDELDAWRHLWWSKLEATIWGNIPENARRKTIVKPDIMSVTDTVVAFFASSRPRLTILPQSQANAKEGTRANYFERVILALYDTLNRQRLDPLMLEMAEQIVHRGHLVTKSLWLDLDSRGARYFEQETDEYEVALDDAGNEVETPVSEIVIEDNGRFPLQCEVIDARNCVWETNQFGEVTRFMHLYRAEWASLCEAYPDLESKDWYPKDTRTSIPVEVVDYWDNEVNAVLINGMLYKPATPHNYPSIPIVVEIVKGRKRENANGLQQREGVPFCYGMLRSIIQLSWAASMSATYLQQAVFFVVKHKGLRKDSMYFQPGEKPDDPPRYVPIADLGPGRQIFPLEENTDLEYMQPPPLSQPLQEFKLDRARDMQLVSFNEGILTGVIPNGPSGASVFQQTIATKARMTPYQFALERGAGRTFAKWGEVIGASYDMGAESLQLTRILENRRYGYEQVAVTKEDFENIGTVIVNIDPKIRFADSEEVALVLQQHAQGLASDLTVMDVTGYVADPELEMARIAWERRIKDPNRPQYQDALADWYGKQMGFEIPEQPQAPDPMQQALAGAMDPSLFASQAGVQPGPVGGPPPEMDMAAAMQAALSRGGV